MCINDRTTHFTLRNAGEAFLTGTGAEIIELTELDGQKIGNGVAGDMTMKLLKAFREYVRRPENGAKI